MCGQYSWSHERTIKTEIEKQTTSVYRKKLLADTSASI